VRRLAVLILCACALPVSLAQAWSWPVDGPVLRPFSFDRAHPYAGGQHRGIDIGAPTGTAVLAPTDGIVSFAGTVPGGGKTVSIQTASGLTATLVHLGSIGVTRGTQVQEGGAVGTVGPTGDVQGDEPFVYFGVRASGDPQGYVDPLTLLPLRPAPAPAPPAAPAETSAPAAPAPDVVPEAPAPAVLAPVLEAQPVPAAEVTGTDAVSAGALTGMDGAGVTVAAAPAPSSAQAAGDGSVSAESEAVARHPAVPTVHVVQMTPGTGEQLRVPVAGRERPALSLRPPVAESAASPTVRVSGPVTGAAPAHGGRVLAPVARATTSLTGHALVLALALAGLTLAIMAFAWRRRRSSLKAARIMSVSQPEETRGAADPEEDPRRAGLAVCGGEEASRPRGRLRSARRHLRSVPPAAGERRPDGEWDRRARDAGDGDRRSRRRLAA
jgi:hypothetical protein